MDNTEEPRSPPILRLPQELLAEILRYIIKTADAEVTITSENMPAKRRRWARELSRLKDPEWKRPPKRAIPGALTACSQLHAAAAEALWGHTTIIIDTFDHLQGYLQTKAGLVAAANTRNLSFGPKHRWEDYANHLFADEARGPSNMGMFLPFQKLGHLELCEGALWHHYRDLADALTEQELSRAMPLWCRREAVAGNGLIPAYLQPSYLRDHLLMTIPDAVFGRLETLTLWYVARPTVNVLPYARHLRAGLWSLEETTGIARCGDHSPVYIKADATSDMNDGSFAPLDREILRLWIEARAAVYWEAADSRRGQWCTWAREVEREWRRDLMGREPERPRTYENIFMADGTVRAEVLGGLVPVSVFEGQPR